MLRFVGINTNADKYCVRHLIRDEKGKNRAKISPVVLWIILLGNGCYIWVPVSKYDLETTDSINYKQLITACDSKTRTLVRKTEDGTEAYPYSAIFCK